jgi:hypothetical protein
MLLLLLLLLLGFGFGFGFGYGLRSIFSFIPRRFKGFLSSEGAFQVGLKV